VLCRHCCNTLLQRVCCVAMKLVNSAIRAKDGDGWVTLRADVPEDLWHAYNLIVVGDVVTATTVRKVRGKREQSCASGTLCATVLQAVSHSDIATYAMSSVWWRWRVWCGAMVGGSPPFSFFFPCMMLLPPRS